MESTETVKILEEAYNIMICVDVIEDRHWSIGYTPSFWEIIKQTGFLHLGKAAKVGERNMNCKLILDCFFYT